MRITLAVAAVALVALGLWLIAAGFLDADQPASSGPQIATAPRATAGPIALGTALLAGGGLVFVMLLRRR
jgi:hypothetical protein